MSRPPSYSVYPRYSAGSPAGVPRETAEKVLNDEREAIGWRLIGYQGEEAKREAETKGLAGICIEHWEYAHRRFERDMHTDRIVSYPIKHGSADRSKPRAEREPQRPTDEQLAALKRWQAAHGRTWKSQLRDAWLVAGTGVAGYEPALQQLRNNFGPTWLDKVRL